MRERWVITNGDIPGHAIDEISSTLRRHHLEKAVRWIDVKTFTRLLSETLPRELLALEPTSTNPSAPGGSHG